MGTPRLYCSPYAPPRGLPRRARARVDGDARRGRRGAGRSVPPRSRVARQARDRFACAAAGRAGLAARRRRGAGDDRSRGRVHLGRARLPFPRGGRRVHAEGPGPWWALALGIGAYVALAAMLFGVLDSPRRTRVVAALAAPVALAIFTAPGAIFRAGVPSPAELLDWFGWMAEAGFHNWTHTLPATIAAVVGTWVALTVLARLGHETRRRALGMILARSARWSSPRPCSGPTFPPSTGRAPWRTSARRPSSRRSPSRLALGAVLPARPARVEPQFKHRPPRVRRGHGVPPFARSSSSSRSSSSIRRSPSRETWRSSRR